MPDDLVKPAGLSHDHAFLGSAHGANERKTWAVIALCFVMMVVEVGGGLAFHSLALVADGLHMATHVIALLVAALAYTIARRYRHDARFSFGTGKLGDLAGFTSAIVLALVAVFIGYEALSRFLDPVTIRFREAIPIAVLGLLVNIASAWLLRGDHHHGPEHSFHTHSDHNLRAAFFHVAADAAVSVLAILGLLAGRYLGWVWMDPMMGIIGASVIIVWAGGLLRDTGSILLDMTPDTALAARIRTRIEADGDEVADLHLWRLGPGHLGAILSIITSRARDSRFYRQLLAEVASLSHVTVEVSLRSLTLLLVLVGAAAHRADAQANYEIQVYGSETVPAHQLMVELHSNFTAQGQTGSIDGLYPTHHQLHETVEMTAGLNDWSEVGVYLFTSEQDGHGVQWVGDHIRPRVRVPESWGWPVGVSVSTEIGYQRSEYSTDTWTWEIRPIIDKTVGRWYFAVNPALERTLRGPDVTLGIGFAPSAKVGFDVTHVVSAGIEYYGDYGSLHRFAAPRDQQQQLFLVADLNLSPLWEFNLGVGLGGTAATDHLIFKAIVGRRFDWGRWNPGRSPAR